MAELLDKAAARAPGGLAHAINLTLLPHAAQDLADSAERLREVHATLTGAWP